MSLFNVFHRKQKSAAPAAPKAAVAVQPAAPGRPTQPQKTVAATSASRAREAAAVSGVLIRRLVTEKATGRTSLGQYTFAVVPDANKITVSQAVRQRYGVKPLAVRMLNVRGRQVRFGLRSGVTKAWKKAIVKLPPGAKIEGEKTTS